MKKFIFISIIIAILILLVYIISFPKDTTPVTNEDQKLLYQDATINKDGSLKIKEVLWLTGDYNGASRKIMFKNSSAYKFTGAYSNFSGDTDIYDSTGIIGLKVFDISQSNFNTFDDINNIEKEYKLVNSASKGDYGVYTLDQKNDSLNVSIYCPANKEKLFYIEYTVNDAIVVHNDIAELYWCFVENLSLEKILNYKLIVHLPQEDNSVMAWHHGSTLNNPNIIDNKTVSLESSNIEPRGFETLRIMFDKTLVPQAKKFSNVNGRENILKYENDISTNFIEQRIDIENNLNEIVFHLETEPSIYYFNEAIKELNKITWDDTLKQNYLEKINSYKDIIRQNWESYIKSKYNTTKNDAYFSQSDIDSLKKNIDEGFDSDFKLEYYAKCDELQKILDERNVIFRQSFLKIIIIGYFILGSICVLKIVKLFFEKHNYYKKYYRDFPSDDKAYIVDYLMHKKITSKTFFVTILDMIINKQILLERNPKIKSDYVFVLNDEKTTSFNTGTENTVITILFSILGKNKKCSMNKLKKFNVNTSNATKLSKHFQIFEHCITKEIEKKEYFKKSNRLNNILKLLVVILFIVSFIFGFFSNESNYVNILIYYFGIVILSFIYIYILSLDKCKTKKGIIEYSKWLAHKRFLKDFGTFDEKDLPDIVLWEKYYVTAVTLGCSNNALDKMKIRIENNPKFDKTMLLFSQCMQYQNIKTFENVFNTIKYNANKETYRSSSSRKRDYSSNNYHSSPGGTGGGGGGWSRF